MGTSGKSRAIACTVATLLAASACATTSHTTPVARTPSTAIPTPVESATVDTEAANDDDEDAEPEVENVEASPCPTNMALVDAGKHHFCVDKWEASLVEVLADGSEKPYPHYLPVDGHDVRAVSEPGVFPQGYISEVQAEDACNASGKRLCGYEEWKIACMGPSRTTFPYGDARRPGVCHDTGKSAVAAVFGAKAIAASAPPPATGGKPAAKTTKGRAAETTKARAAKTTTKKGAAKKRPAPAKKSTRPASVEPSVWTKLNDPALGQVEGSLARTGDHGECVNSWGAYDMVGNLHEWVLTDPHGARGTFAGGYYLDTAQNGDGCNYKTQAHAHDYHDYSTGFRCCQDTP